MKLDHKMQHLYIKNIKVSMKFHKIIFVKTDENFVKNYF